MNTYLKLQIRADNIIEGSKAPSTHIRNHLFVPIIILVPIPTLLLFLITIVSSTLILVPFPLILLSCYFYSFQFSNYKIHFTIHILILMYTLAAFFEGGRLTFNDVHYVAEGDNLIPAGETPFAKDAHFGFSASNLKDWVVEKTKGAVRRENVTSVGLKDIREGGPGAVANILESQVHGNTVIINGNDCKYSLMLLISFREVF